MMLYIEYYLNNNKNNIEYLMIINHNKLIKDEKENNNNNINISNMKEFVYIGEVPDIDDNVNIIINILNLSNKNKNNKYKGYDKNNKLLFYREGETQIQSFDLIDLFKYNKKIIHINLINENIIINYNEERTKLEIINNELNKSEIQKIIKKNNYLELRHFSQFIYNQKSLKELTIIKFDINLNDIINNNITTLNMNYLDDNSILKYIIKNDENLKLNAFFPNLANLNIGGNYDNIVNLLNKSLIDTLRKIKIITKKSKAKNISKLFKKLDLYKIETIINNLVEIKNDNVQKKNNINYLNDDKEEDEEENENNEYYEEEEEYEEYEEYEDIIKSKQFTNLQKEIIRKNIKF